MYNFSGVKCYHPSELIYDAIKPIGEVTFKHIMVIQHEIALSDKYVEFNTNNIEHGILSIELGNSELFVDRYTYWKDCTVGIGVYGNVVWFSNDIDDVGKVMINKK